MITRIELLENNMIAFRDSFGNAVITTPRNCDARIFNRNGTDGLIQVSRAGKDVAGFLASHIAQIQVQPNPPIVSSWTADQLLETLLTDFFRG